MINFFPVQEVLAAPQNASSTTHNMAVSWPYVLFSVLLVISLIGVALKIVRKESDESMRGPNKN